jgi:hypothetical protein
LYTLCTSTPLVMPVTVIIYGLYKYKYILYSIIDWDCCRNLWSILIENKHEDIIMHCMLFYTSQFSAV